MICSWSYSYVTDQLPPTLLCGHNLFSLPSRVARQAAASPPLGINSWLVIGPSHCRAEHFVPCACGAEQSRREAATEGCSIHHSSTVQAFIVFSPGTHCDRITFRNTTAAPHNVYKCYHQFLHFYLYVITINKSKCNE